MKRTISLKLELSQEQACSLLQTEEAFAKGCNAIVPFAQEHRCWNQVALHTLCYYKVRTEIPALGPQEAQGIRVIYVNPAYTSLTRSKCDSLGSRHKHQFKCSSCGSSQHSDRNACQNLCKLARSVVPATASVNMPMVAMVSPLVTSFRL